MKGKHLEHAHYSFVYSYLSVGVLLLVVVAATVFR